MCWDRICLNVCVAFYQRHNSIVLTSSAILNLQMIYYWNYRFQIKNGYDKNNRLRSFVDCVRISIKKHNYISSLMRSCVCAVLFCACKYNHSAQMECSAPKKKRAIAINESCFCRFYHMCLVTKCGQTAFSIASQQQLMTTTTTNISIKMHARRWAFAFDIAMA